MEERCGALIAKVGVENCAYAFDTLFSFFIPPELTDAVVPGRRVLVPFGRGDRLRQGFVFAVEPAEENREDADLQLKPVFSAADEAPLLDGELLRLAETLRERTFSTYFACAKAMLPGGMCLKRERTYKLSPEAETRLSGCTETERELAAFIRAEKKPVKESALCRAFGSKTTGTRLRRLEAAGVLTAGTESLKISGDLELKKLRLAENAEALGPFTEKQQAVVDFLTETDAATGKEIAYYTGVSADVLRRLTGKGVLTEETETVQRRPETVYPVTSSGEPRLSDAQMRAFRRLYEAYRAPKPGAALLYGVTGSGKTNVYLQLIDRVLQDGRGVIVLVPEISLTPQTVALFLRRFGDRVAVMHSGLSAGERRDEFFRVKRGEANVVVGTRSAVFAPVKDLGAVIIDEEQEHTYQSELSPRYDARTVARLRANAHGALLVLASATPSVESYARAKAGVYRLCTLPERYGPAVLPQVITVDMNDKDNGNPFSALSVRLERELKENLERGEQSILLVNRRGYNTFVVCKECKTVISCPHCSISMTYHAANNRLMCHYCGYSVPYAERCPACGAANVRYAGFGTQRVEQELQFRFPSARVLRMDADTTTAKNAHRLALSAFAAGDYDILVGTQMVAKGLDFPNVSLVGIISADNELYSGDFRGAEKTFDLITQVVGRAGRGEKKGRAVIQTLTPDNAILELAARQDYPAFFEQELTLRRALIYPPFCDLCLLSFSGTDRAQTEACALRFRDLLKEAAEREYANERLILLGPLAHKVPKVNNLYRQKIILKCKNSPVLREMIGGLLRRLSAEKEFREIGFFAVMNPDRTD